MYHVLVVDDESTIRKALEMGLASRELEVDVAEDGNTGVKIVYQKNYDILIVDLCLPDMDGLDVIRRAKRDFPEIISIATTGNPTMEGSEKAMTCGADIYLEKPIDMRSIKNAIKQGLEERT
jgi:DNA-binding response OmpR family regulator